MTRKDVSRDVNIDVLDACALIDAHYRRQTGWALELTEGQFFAATVSLLRGAVYLTDQDGTPALSVERFVERVARARAYATAGDVDEQSVADDYEGEFQRVLTHAVDA